MRIRFSSGEFPAPQKAYRLTVTLAVLIWAALPAIPISQAQASKNTASSATITFTLDFPHSDPEHYSIRVEVSGQARYECAPEGEAYTAEFDVSPGNRIKIFDLAKQARYFAGNVDSGNRKLAFTGTKILSYHDGERDYTARYDYSKLPSVQQLTALFQSMAATLEFGRHVIYYHRYQKLALYDELKQMDDQARANQLSEIQAVVPILEEIVDDSSVINVVRARARDLIQMGNGPATTAGRDQR